MENGNSFTVVNHKSVVLKIIKTVDKKGVSQDFCKKCYNKKETILQNTLIFIC